MIDLPRQQVFVIERLAEFGNVAGEPDNSTRTTNRIDGIERAIKDDPFSAVLESQSIFDRHAFPGHLIAHRSVQYASVIGMNAFQKATRIGVEFVTRLPPDLLICPADIGNPLFIDLMNIKNRIDRLGELMKPERICTCVCNVAVDPDPLDNLFVPADHGDRANRKKMVYRGGCISPVGW